MIIPGLETLTNCAECFYERQFITRRIINHDILSHLEDVLAACINSEDLCLQGLPSVHDIADIVNMSTKYLSSLLKQFISKTTHIDS